MSSLPADGHVHTEWSWDAARGDMEATCRQAMEIGLPSIAFTEHADFVAIHDGQRRLDPAGYLEAVARCRAAFPSLRILSGAELGEPHLYPGEVADLLSSGAFDRVLGSIHALELPGGLLDMSQPQVWGAGNPADTARAYLAEVTRLAESNAPFAVLAHIDYFKRYWPHAVRPYSEAAFEAEYRAILRALARREGVLEVNTTRGAEPHRGLCPGPLVLRWWREEGGRAVAFGSDAHEPSRIAAGFVFAAGAVEAAGFRPSDDPNGFWVA